MYIILSTFVTFTSDFISNLRCSLYTFTDFQQFNGLFFMHITVHGVYSCRLVVKSFANSKTYQPRLNSVLIASSSSLPSASKESPSCVHKALLILYLERTLPKVTFAVATANLINISIQ